MPIQQFFSYMMAITSQFSMRWWWWGLLCTRPMLIWIFIVLAHWNNNTRGDMLLHSDTLNFQEYRWICSQ